MKRSVFLFLLLFSASLAAQKIPAFVTDSLDGYMERALKQWNLPGVAIAVVKDGKVILAKGYGVREIGQPGKVDENSLFMIASCTKAFTATALAMLESEKKMALDQPVSQWLGDFRLYDSLAGKQCAVRDLLCHRLGFGTFQGDFIHWDSDLSRKEIIRQMAKYEPKYGFRAHFGYCNAAFTAAGQIIPEVTSGIPWDDFVRTRFFEPLGMSRTTTQHKYIISDANACRPHTRIDGKEQVFAYDNVDNLGPAASINSCVNDLSKWVLMQLDSGRFNGKKIVPFDVLQETRAPQIMMENNAPLFPSTHFNAYGLGWFLRDYSGRKIIWHDGGAGGFLSNITIVPEERLGFVILTNSDNNAIFEALHHQLLDAFFGNPYRNYSNIYQKWQSAQVKNQDADLKKSKELVAKKKTPPVPLKAFAGTYSNLLYGTISIEEKNGVLVMSMQHHPKIGAILEYRDGNTLLCTYKNPVFGIRVTPFEIADKKLRSVTLSANEFLDYGTYEFVKQE
ncbi:MAG: beta-lactamase [Bacteroidetes bacterium]|nr:MAG: beta-lactamase [Bacteroidota bacterium]